MSGSAGIGPRGTPRDDPWRIFPARIAGVAAETPGVVTYELTLADTDADYRCAPGQFNLLYLPGVGEAAISVSGAPLRHTVRLAGAVTSALARLGRGGSLGLRGPFGTPWPLDACRGRHVVVAAGGIGLAPLRPVIETVLADPDGYGELSVLCGARSPEHLLYAAEYPQWRARGATVEVTVDRAPQGWRGHVGVLPLLVDRMPMPDPENTVLLICGPQVMMSYAVQSALRRGVPAQRLWLNLERHMNCGVGLCGHCQLGPLFLCKDGPVARYDAIAPFLEVHDL